MSFRVEPHVAAAIAANEPVVALESTVFTHGLPQASAMALAESLIKATEALGAVPAIVGVVAGDLVVGLSRRELERLAQGPAEKASLWNLPALVATKGDAGATVAATLHGCALAGIRVFATGGVGGVHHEAFDESADIEALARYAVITVCAGPKSVLNIAATLERLESRGVCVTGYRTDRVPGFLVRETNHPVPSRSDTPEQVVDIYRAQLELGLSASVLVCNPVSQGLAPAAAESWLSQALAEAKGATGKGVTPKLLARLFELSGGDALNVNVRLIEENTALAAAIAKALVGRGHAKVVPA